MEKKTGRKDAGQRLLWIKLAIALVIMAIPAGLMPLRAEAAGNPPIADYSNWEGDYKLDKNLTTGGIITVQSGKNATIDLNGYNITCNNPDRHICVWSGGKLTFKDSSPESKGKLIATTTGNMYMNGVIIEVRENATLVLDGVDVVHTQANYQSICANDQYENLPCPKVILKGQTKISAIAMYFGVDKLPGPVIEFDSTYSPSGPMGIWPQWFNGNSQKRKNNPWTFTRGGYFSNHNIDEVVKLHPGYYSDYKIVKNGNEAQVKYETGIVNYTVTYQRGEGSGSAAEFVYTKDTGIKLKDPVALGFTAPAGKVFDCWQIGSDRKAVGDDYTVTANTSVVALWKLPVETPVITTQPPSSDLDMTYGVAGDNRTISITVADLTESGTLSYKWYKSESSTTDGTAISGATAASYTIPVTEDVGTHYYYCVVTNTTAEGTASATSNRAKAVIAPGTAIKTAPKANQLTYTGGAQDLVTAAVTDSSYTEEVLYAIGADADTAPEDDQAGTPEGEKKWKTSIPQGTDAKTYYVWYKAVADANHSAQVPECVTVKIKKASATIETAPEAKQLTYTGAAQELVTAGSANTGVVLYAIGTDETAAPPDDPEGTQEEDKNWKTSIPKGTDAGTYHVWYKAKGNDNYNDSEAQHVRVVISSPDIDTDAALPEAKQDEEYSVTLKLKDTTIQNMDWKVTQDSLPEGLTLDSGTGKITGKPSKPGEYRFTVKENTSGAEKEFTLKVNAKEVPEIKTDSILPEAAEGEEYSTTVELKNPPSEGVKWKVTKGNLPKGLSLDPGTGKITGTPEEAGTFTFTLKEENTGASKEFTLKVNGKGDPGTGEIKTDSKLPEAAEGEEYNVTLELKDTTVKDVDWEVIKGALPEGLTLDSKTGKITGTPSKAGEYVFTVKEKNTGAEKEFTINVRTSSSHIDTKGDVGLDAVQSEENLQTLEGSIDNLPEEEQQKVKEAKGSGQDIVYVFETEGLNEDDAEGAPDIKEYNNEKGLTMGKLFDISLFIRVKDTGDTLGRIRRLNNKVTFAVSIPVDMRREGRTFYILRFHDGVDVVGKGQGEEIEAESDLFSTYAISYTDSEEPEPDKKKSKSHKKDDDDDHTPASWILNPNEKQQLVIKYTGTPEYLAAGYQEQGAAANELFKAAVPAGWIKAFSFNVLDQKRQPELGVKNGIMVLYIPGEYIKANRQYALLGMNKAGQVILFADTDLNPNTVTINLANMDGYAFDLIYKD